MAAVVVQASVACRPGRHSHGKLEQKTDKLAEAGDIHKLAQDAAHAVRHWATTRRTVTSPSPLRRRPPRRSTW
jgi:hypothetical protein